MNTLILYGTKCGATKQIAEQLEKAIGGNVTVQNIKDGKPNLAILWMIRLWTNLYDRGNCNKSMEE